MTSRVTGVSAGVNVGPGGVSATAGVSFGPGDKAAVRALFALCESKRVFVDSVADEDPDFAVHSVLEIRQDAAAILAGARDKGLAAEAKRILDAAKAFVTAAGRNGARFEADRPRFAVHLSLFRSTVESSCKKLAFDFDVAPPSWVR